MTFFAKKTDFLVPEKPKGYTEREVQRFIGEIAIRHIRDYGLSNFSGLIYSTAGKTVHSGFEEQEGDTMAAGQVEKLLEKADADVQKLCEKLLQEQAVV
ncbi:MAG: hypothetical protein ACI4FX_10915 [Agathobacter sp.]